MDTKKSLVALALVALIGIVGGTYAYFTITSNLNNTFKAGTYATSVTEEFVSPTNWTPGTTTQKKINVANKGSVDIVARAKYTEAWTSASGASLPTVRDGLTIAQFTTGANWTKGTGDWYYYNAVLTNGQTSSDFISAVTFNPNFQLKEDADIKCTETKTATGTTVDCANLTTGYAGATYTLNVTIETIQADQAKTVWSADASVIPSPAA